MNFDTESIVDFNQIISERFGQLTKSEKQIANYLLNNQDEFGFPGRGRAGCSPGFE